MISAHRVGERSNGVFYSAPKSKIMIRMAKERPKETAWIFNEISQAKSNGLFVMIDGIYCENLEQVDRMLLIREEESYMKDYVGDDKGKIIGIAFDKVKIRNY